MRLTNNMKITCFKPSPTLSQPYISQYQNTLDHLVSYLSPPLPTPPLPIPIFVYFVFVSSCFVCYVWLVLFHFAIVNVYVIVFSLIGNTYINILLLYFLHLLFVELNLCLRCMNKLFLNQKDRVAVHRAAG